MNQKPKKKCQATKKNKWYSNEGPHRYGTNFSTIANIFNIQ